jgi:hypothetical protein
MGRWADGPMGRWADGPMGKIPAGFDFSATPVLRAWLDRLWARLAWRKTEALIFGIEATLSRARHPAR